MPRIACLTAGLAAAMLAAADASAAAGNEHRRAAPPPARHPHSPPAFAATHPARAPAPRPVFVGYAPVYPASYPSRQLPGFAGSPSPPSLYYLPAASPSAPPFSFSGSGELPGWHWQRVSLMQLDAEVRARRAARSQPQAVQQPGARMPGTD